jgi:hypothetical protein
MKHVYYKIFLRNIKNIMCHFESNALKFIKVSKFKHENFNSNILNLKIEFSQVTLHADGHF